MGSAGQKGGSLILVAVTVTELPSSRVRVGQFAMQQD